MTSEKSAEDLRWFEQTYAAELASLRARMVGLSDQDQVLFLLPRLVRVEHEKASLLAALEWIETSARDIVKLAKLERSAQREEPS